MSDLLFARALMGMSLAFHILFAAAGMGMPLLMAIAEGIYLRRGKSVYLDLARRWAKGTAILFAVGAVSGTVLSFELGLLWPGFMAHAGAVIGMPFSLEGFAFFTEGIFLGLFLYGWNRLPPRVHWLTGWMVALGGVFSGIFVVTANAWMNTPAGFDLVDGEFTNIRPMAAMLNPAAFHEVVHMTVAAFVATGFVVAGIHAYFLLRNPSSEFHRAAFRIGATVGCVAIPLQILSGDLAARRVAKLQPAKLAALEAHYRTQTRAPLILGGVPDDDQMRVRYALEIPSGLSLGLGGSAETEVIGLDQFPREDWPNVRLVHWSFDAMVACGMFLLVVAAIAGWKAVRRRPLVEQRGLLKLFVIAAPMGFIAIETGWMVTELGRQPWIIYGVMRTSEAVTPMPGLVVPFLMFTLLYLFLGVSVVSLLKRQLIQSGQTPPPEDSHET